MCFHFGGRLWMVSVYFGKCTCFVVHCHACIRLFPPDWKRWLSRLVSKREIDRHMKLFWGSRHVKLKANRDRALFQSALAVFYFSRTKTETTVSTLSAPICFNCAVKWKPLFCIWKRIERVAVSSLLHRHLFVSSRNHTHNKPSECYIVGLTWTMLDDSNFFCVEVVVACENSRPSSLPARRTRIATRAGSEEGRLFSQAIKGRCNPTSRAKRTSTESFFHVKQTEWSCLFLSCNLLFLFQSAMQNTQNTPWWNLDVRQEFRKYLSSGNVKPSWVLKIFLRLRKWPKMTPTSHKILPCM